MTQPSLANAEGRPAVKCPHCGEALDLGVTSQLMDKSRMSFKLHPNKGELLSARTIGDTLSQMHRMMVAFGKELGVKENVLVEGITFEDGGVQFDLLVTRHDHKVGQRAPTNPDAGAS